MKFTDEEAEKFNLEIKGLVVKFLEEVNKSSNDRNIRFKSILEQILLNMLGSYVKSYAIIENTTELNLFCQLSDKLIKDIT